MMLTGENVVVDPLIRELMESAALGEAARLFIQSELGGHLTKKAADEVEQALAELVDVDPNDAKAVGAIQLRIKIAKQAVVWLTDTMSEGQNAMRQLDEES